MKIHFFLPLISCLLMTSSAVAGDEWYRTTPRKNSDLISGKNSEIYVAGVVDCPNYPDPDATNRCDAFKSCVERGEKDFRQKIAKEESKAAKAQLLERLANLYTNSEKKLPEAIKAMTESYELTKEFDKELALRRLGALGILQLRLGEVTNCIKYHNAESCLFPLKGKARHREKYGARKAKEVFLDYLKERPDDDHIKWLLNIAGMALGEHPDKLPKEFVIPESVFKSKVSFPQFPDIAGPVGLQGQRQGAGSVLVDDINGDGLLDVVITPKMDCQGTLYFENDGKTAFVDKSKESGLGEQLGTRSLVQADFNNDGLIDLYISRGGWIKETDKPYVYNTLVKNSGGGKFVDVTNDVGLKTDWNSGGSANWVDFDKDGWIDLFVCNYERDVELFKNEKGKFKNVANVVGIDNNARCKGSTWGDVNNDGWPDLFISNYGQTNKLFLNQAGKSFTVDDQRLLQGRPTLSYTVWFFDVENDGDLDLYVSVFNREVKEYAKALQGKPFKGDLPRLFQNDGKGQFTDVTEKFGLHHLPLLTMGANYGDMNGDGYPDMYLGSGAVSFGDLGLHHAYLNMGGNKFEDITTAVNMGNLQKGHGIAFADIENRGNQDVFAVNGGGFPGDQFYPSLYKNPGMKNKWLTLLLTGTKSNRSAIGARVRVKIKENSKFRDIHKLVGPGGSFGSNPLRAEIGLGKASRIEEVEIRWPNAEDTRTLLKKVPLNKFIAVTEGETGFKVAELPKTKLRAKESEHSHHHHLE